MSRVKRIQLTKEPVLKVHHWIVKVLRGRSCKYHHCMNKRDVQEIKNREKAGCRIQIFKATHDFKEAFSK